jgi:acyl-CoA synthetase (NDP forming)
LSVAEHPLEFLFHPKSIAIVGASTQPGPGSGFLMSLLDMKYPGKVYPVNPKADEIQGLKCYPALLDVPGEVDYVISAVPTQFVMQLLDDCAAKGVRAVHFFTSGFRETGDDDRAGLEGEVARRARELGIRMLGPNCMGLYCAETGLSFMPQMPAEPGTVTFISQSGANAGEYCRSISLRGVHTSKSMSYGNAADLNESDFLDYAAQDAKTEIIACYIEGVKDGQRFIKALKRTASSKPTIILKGGRTDAGGRATMSHTGSLAGSMQVFEAACRQAGALLADDMEQLIDCTVALSLVGRVQGPRVAVVGMGGGHSVLAADAVASAGMELPHFPEATQRALAEFTPVAGNSVRNPVDTNVGFGPEGERLQRETLRIVAEASNIDIVFFQGSIGGGPRRGVEQDEMVQRVKKLAATTREVMEKAGKPVVVPLYPPFDRYAVEPVFTFQEEAARIGIATFPSIARTARAMRKVLDWQEKDPTSS